MWKTWPKRADYAAVKVGNRYHHLIVIDIKYPNITCLCDCWNTIKTSVYHLIDREQVSCKKCMYQLSENIKHWLSRKILSDEDLAFKRKYNNMKSRCENPNSISYYNYWWRGIKCEWTSLSDFKEDMYDSYIIFVKKHWIDNTTLDRINSDWNYCKENCRRATKQEQAMNRRTNKSVNIDWKEYTYKEIANIIWCGYPRACQRCIRYNEWEITKEELLYKWLRIWKRKWKVIIIKWKKYNVTSLAKKIWCTKMAASYRIKKRKAWLISEEELVKPKHRNKELFSNEVSKFYKDTL